MRSSEGQATEDVSDIQRGKPNPTIKKRAELNERKEEENRTKPNQTEKGKGKGKKEEYSQALAVSTSLLLSPNDRTYFDSRTPASSFDARMSHLLRKRMRSTCVVWRKRTSREREGVSREGCMRASLTSESNTWKYLKCVE